MSHPLLQLKDLSIGYDGNPLYSNLNLTIREGELVALIGANGAGKSTLLKTLTNSLPPVGGDVMIARRRAKELSPKDLAKLVSIVTTERTMAGGLCVEELVGLGRQPYTGFFGRLSRKDRAIVGESLDAVGMSCFAPRSVASLSDGERQKVMIARALAQRTPLMILDEPTSFLDVASRLEIFQLLADLAHSLKTAVIVSTHDVATALRLSDRLWLMNKDEQEGNVVIAGTPSELKENGALETMFRGRRVHFDSQIGDFLPD